MTPDRVRDALGLLALDATGLGGLWLRARPGPVRDAVLTHVSAAGARRLGPQITAEMLDGGVDLSTTLSSGRLHMRAGLLDTGGLLCLGMAERATPELAARLGQALDAERIAVVAVDEACEDEPGLAALLADRLGLFLALDGLPHDALGRLDVPIPDGTHIRFAELSLSDTHLHMLVETAALLGIPGLRAPLLAARAARGLAALDGRDTVSDTHLERAVALTLGHRGTPPSQDETTHEQEPQPPDEGNDTTERDTTQDDRISPELLVAAALANLPPDLLRQLSQSRNKRASKSASGSGAAQRGNRRGRPLPAHAGRLSGNARLDLPATLRAAAPWQTMRAKGAPARMVHLRSADFRVKRYEERSDRLLVFCVDASGSQAVTRLAEAKGAIELLLAQAYARRDHVALVAFRGTGADLLLPPTRSLVQTKKRLAALPGGGGTPLAAGLTAACDVARLAGRQGFTPSLALLTDGRANIDLEGLPNRDRAAADAQDAARQVMQVFPGGLVIDTGRRPSPALAKVAEIAAATYLPLPRADSASLSRAISPMLAN